MRQSDETEARCVWVPFAGFAELESLSTCEDRRTLFAWCRLPDGRGAVWQLDPTRQPGEMQTVALVDGA